MINITRKEDCVGCNSCVQKCPVHCITMTIDEQGFLYPNVDLDKCINCGLCEKVCPVINQAAPRKPEYTYAAWNINDNIRMASSSGGVFFALSKKIIMDGGVVFGAKFNEMWEVVHSYAETLEDVKAFQGSKYVQSKIGDSFKDVERFLKEGRKVMFTGTPCQISGLRLFLRKDYGKQLLLVETACHSVPSPKIWIEYLNSLNCTSFNRILFRDKTNGWEDYNFSLMRDNQILYSEAASNNMFMQGFICNLYTRPSCFECPAKMGKSQSDILLADYWGLRNHYPELQDKRGVSLVLVSSENGSEILNTIDIMKVKTRCDYAIEGNSSIVKCAKQPKGDNVFWERYSIEGISCIPSIVMSMKPSLFTRIYNKVKYILKR